MMAGALALFTYASFVSWIMVRRNVKALVTTICSMRLWFCVAFGVWHCWMR
jgi:hypothetical protein